MTHHPKVVSGEWSRREALHDFLQQWDANTDGTVTREEFIDYFKDISLGIEDNAQFIECIRNIFPTLAPPPLPTPRVDGDPLGRPGRTPDPAAEGKLAREARRSSQGSASRKVPTPKEKRKTPPTLKVHDEPVAVEDSNVFSLLSIEDDE